MSTDDLVARLRREAETCATGGKRQVLFRQSADEIERLRAMTGSDRWIEDRYAQILRARAALYPTKEAPDA